MQVLSPRALGQPPSPESLSVPGLQSRAITPESPQAPSRVADFHLTQIPGGLARGGVGAQRPLHCAAKCCEMQQLGGDVKQS